MQGARRAQVPPAPIVQRRRRQIEVATVLCGPQHDLPVCRLLRTLRCRQFSRLTEHFGDVLAKRVFHGNRQDALRSTVHIHDALPDVDHEQPVSDDVHDCAPRGGQYVEKAVAHYRDRHQHAGEGKRDRRRIQADERPRKHQVDHVAHDGQHQCNGEQCRLRPQHVRPLGDLSPQGVRADRQARIRLRDVHPEPRTVGLGDTHPRAAGVQADVPAHEAVILVCPHEDGGNDGDNAERRQGEKSWLAAATRVPQGKQQPEQRYPSDAEVLDVGPEELVLESLDSEFHNTAKAPDGGHDAQRRQCVASRGIGPLQKAEHDGQCGDTRNPERNSIGPVGPVHRLCLAFLHTQRQCNRERTLFSRL